MAFLARLRKIRRRMRADAQKGSAALEFAFVAPVFFVLLMGIFEAGIMFFAQSALQNAVTTLARQIRTGQAQTASMSQTAFRNAICGMVTPLIACDADLQIDVKAYPAGYGSIDLTPPLNSNKKLNTNLNRWLIGGACDVVLVRAFYAQTVYTPVLNWFLVNMANSAGDPAHLVSAAAAFRNEPYVAAAGGC